MTPKAYVEAVFRAVFPNAQVVEFSDSEDEILWVNVDGNHFQMEIGSDDSDFHFRDGFGTRVLFPIPDDLEDSN
jgi:hypothetical protein